MNMNWKISWKGGTNSIHSTLAFNEGDVKRIKKNVKAFGGKNITVKVIGKK